MPAVRSAIIAVMAALLWSVAAAADDGSWKMPNLNPFAAKGKPPTSGHVSDGPSDWHMPKLWPTTTAKSNAAAKVKRRPAPQSTLTKMGKGTQQLFSKTADALNPWDDKKPAPQTQVTGSNTRFTNNKPAKTEQKSSGVLPASWWSSEEAKTTRPKSVNDFLSQPRLQ